MCDDFEQGELVGPDSPRIPRAVLTYAEPGTCPASMGLSFFEHKRSLGHESRWPYTHDRCPPAASEARPPPAEGSSNCSPPHQAARPKRSCGQMVSRLTLSPTEVSPV